VRQSDAGAPLFTFRRFGFMGGGSFRRRKLPFAPRAMNCYPTGPAAIGGSLAKYPAAQAAPKPGNNFFQAQHAARLWQLHLLRHPRAARVLCTTADSHGPHSFQFLDSESHAMDKAT
jgi:hypothetical protein